MENLEVHSLDNLHTMLKMTESDSTTDHLVINQIKQEIRNRLPIVDTGASLPHKKTISGQTQVLCMNYVRSQTENQRETEIEYLRFFVQTANILGLRLEITTDEKSREDIEQELGISDYDALDYQVTESHGPLSKWAEDHIEFLENGKIAILNEYDETLLIRAMQEGRRIRWHSKLSQENLEDALENDHLWIPLGIRVNSAKTNVVQSNSENNFRNVAHIRAYIEGGNMITGEDALGKPIILVGKDAIATTAYLYQLDNENVKQIICEDFGIGNIEQVVCIEQPGKFHLDMGILFLGNGVVIVNDNSKELCDAKEMAEMVPCITTKQKAAKLKLQCSLEEDAARDLEEAGLQVIRKKLEDEIAYNFFNGEFVEGSDGLNYYMTNGGPLDQEAAFKVFMVNELEIVKDVIFSPKALAHRSLQDQGGVGCRIKGRPT